MCVCVCVCMCVCVFVCLSLSLSIYIYIYIYSKKAPNRQKIENKKYKQTLYYLIINKICTLS